MRLPHDWQNFIILNELEFKHEIPKHRCHGGEKFKGDANLVQKVKRISEPEAFY